MTSSSNDLFYSRLPVNEIPLGELLMEQHLFYRFPENWHVIITDVEGSSAAVNRGMHENVNLVATGSLVWRCSIWGERRIYTGRRNVEK